MTLTLKLAREHISELTAQRDELLTALRCWARRRPMATTIDLDGAARKATG